jgi:hypothetical protein
MWFWMMGYLAGLVAVVRFKAVPEGRRSWLEDMKKWEEKKRHTYSKLSSEKPMLALSVIAVIGWSLFWPLWALYRILWPRGVDSKLNKEKLKAAAEAAAAEAVEEAERVAKLFGLRNPEE